MLFVLNEGEGFVAKGNMGQEEKHSKVTSQSTGAS